MNKKILMVGIFLVLAVVVSTNAYALGGENCPLQGACNSVGGFLYNALPWNWGNWFGK